MIYLIILPHDLPTALQQLPAQITLALALNDSVNTWEIFIKCLFWANTVGTGDTVINRHNFSCMELTLGKKSIVQSVQWLVFLV